MLSFEEFIQLAALLATLRNKYNINLNNVVCDMLTIVARAAHLHGVPLKAMLEAVRRGATIK
ncbi:MAG TPA: hypothetical protein PK156_33740 [Polyangium sp.]|nr:hypothetical protein [Polyangium sp.]